MSNTTQSGVRMHSDTPFGYGPYYPSVNVKMWGHKFPEGWQLARHYNVTEAAGYLLSEWAFDRQCDLFWSQVGAVVEKHLETTDWSAAGRSGGWLEVRGIGDQEDVCKWRKGKVERWQKFEKAVHDFMDELCEWDAVIELIDSTDWVEAVAKDGKYDE